MKCHILSLVLFTISLASPISYGQSSSSATGSRNTMSSGASGNNGEPAIAGGLGFSIESEMLTYKSLEANSEAIACDIAKYLYGGEVGSASQNAPCIIQPGSNARSGVIIVSPGGEVFSDLQAWRADMAAMNALELRANKLCAIEAQSRGGPAAATVPSPFDFTIPGQVLPLVASTLGLFASNQSVSPVTGTVQDQALMNGVARQLKALNVAILIPEIYSPYLLGDTDYSSSPFFSNLATLVVARGVCAKAEKDSSGAHPQQTTNAEIDSVIKSIDAFMEITLGITPAPIDTGAAPAATKPDNTLTKTSAPSTGTIVHLTSVLAADRLARAIGVKADGTIESDSKWHHILWLKALESGGSVLKEGNVFGAKVSYSGGAVATYAFFSLDGNLDCSGNVFDFQGAVRPKDYAATFRQPVADAANQLTFVRGGCSQPK
jgi:hypothetical protein